MMSMAVVKEHGVAARSKRRDPSAIDRWVLPRPGVPLRKMALRLLFDEVRAEEVLDLRPVDFLRPAPLELIEGFGEREAGEADTLRKTLVFALGDLALDQAL